MRLKVFISSTCYDLGVIRSQLREFVERMGYEPVMSEYNDVLYDPSDHTHKSCINEVANADIVILIIGSRYGGEVIPSVKDMIDFAKLADQSRNNEILDQKCKLSITQSEVLRAFEGGKPVYAFIQADVYHDHYVYEKNKGNEEVAKNIKYPSIDKNETAYYMFEFINYLRGRLNNNAIFPFEKYEDITSALTKQWSGLFQRLLSENSSEKHREALTVLTGQIEDLKALMMSSMSRNGKDELQQTASGVLKYRQLISILASITTKVVLLKDIDWATFKRECKIKEERQVQISGRLRNIILLEDDTFYIFRFGAGSLEEYSKQWDIFRKLDSKKKEAIIYAISETLESSLQRVIYVNEKLDNYVKRFSSTD